MSSHSIALQWWFDTRKYFLYNLNIHILLGVQNDLWGYMTSVVQLP